MQQTPVISSYHYETNTKHMRVYSFQVGLIRQHLAGIYERASNWREAANVLVGIPLETAQK